MRQTSIYVYNAQSIRGSIKVSIWKGSADLCFAEMRKDPSLFAENGLLAVSFVEKANKTKKN